VGAELVAGARVGGGWGRGTDRLKQVGPLAGIAGGGAGLKGRAKARAAGRAPGTGGRELGYPVCPVGPARRGPRAPRG